MIPLFFDAETTGFRDYKLDINHPSQPRIIQLAAILTDENGKLIAEMNEYVRPDGWEVPEEITKLTGITTEKLMRVGKPMPQVLECFNSMKARCTVRVGHNVTFDKQMLLREAMAYDIPHNSDGLETICTMKVTRAYCALPKNKAPKLQESYEKLCGNTLHPTHNAYDDARACMEIFFAAKKLGLIPAGA